MSTQRNTVTVRWVSDSYLKSYYEVGPHTTVERILKASSQQYGLNPKRCYFNNRLIDNKCIVSTLAKNPGGPINLVFE